MKKANLLFLILGIASLAYILIAGISRFVSKGDFDVYTHISCDPTSESCFAIANESDGLSYFKIAFIKAIAAPLCDPTIPDGCPEISCKGLPDSQCRTYECSEETIKAFELEDTSCSSHESQEINDP